MRPLKLANDHILMFITKIFWSYFTYKLQPEIFINSKFATYNTANYAPPPLLEFKKSFGNYHLVCPTHPERFFFWDTLYTLISYLIYNLSSLQLRYYLIKNNFIKIRLLLFLFSLFTFFHINSNYYYYLL